MLPKIRKKMKKNLKIKPMKRIFPKKRLFKDPNILRRLNHISPIVRKKAILEARENENSAKLYLPEIRRLLFDKNFEVSKAALRFLFKFNPEYPIRVSESIFETEHYDPNKLRLASKIVRENSKAEFAQTLFSIIKKTWKEIKKFNKKEKGEKFLLLNYNIQAIKGILERKLNKIPKKFKSEILKWSLKELSESINSKSNIPPFEEIIFALSTQIRKEDFEIAKKGIIENIKKTEEKKLAPLYNGRLYTNLFKALKNISPKNTIDLIIEIIPKKSKNIIEQITMENSIDIIENISKKIEISRKDKLRILDWLSGTLKSERPIFRNKAVSLIYALELENEIGYNPALYSGLDVEKMKSKKFGKRKFSKTGSRTILLEGPFVNKALVRVISEKSAWIWTMLHEFPELGIKVEEMLSKSEYEAIKSGKKPKENSEILLWKTSIPQFKEENNIVAYSKIGGHSLGGIAKSGKDQELVKRMQREKRRMLARLKELGLDFGHILPGKKRKTHDFNFTIERDTLRWIDWDDAKLIKSKNNFFLNARRILSAEFGSEKAKQIITEMVKYDKMLTEHLKKTGLRTLKRRNKKS